MEGEGGQDQVHVVAVDRWARQYGNVAQVALDGRVGHCPGRPAVDACQ